MKKLFILSALLVFALSVSGQRSGSTTTLLPNETYKTLTMTAADTVHTTSYWIFSINKPKTQYFAFAIAVDSMPLTTKRHVYFDVLGSVDGSNWVATGATQVKYGQTVDSTFVLYDVSTGVLWRKLKLQAVAQGAVEKGPKITAISVKVGDK
jgi:hypothetical protein